MQHDLRSPHRNEPNRPRIGRSDREQAPLRDAVLRSFCDPPARRLETLLTLSAQEWTPLLHWLDTSGLALYLLDRLTELRLLSHLPEEVRQRLSTNLADNTKRMEAMVAESCALQQSLQREGVVYAVLKGFSLWPHAVPRLELRSQLDLDFLVAQEHADTAQRLLESHGYVLKARSGRSLEFTTPHPVQISLDHLYKPSLRRSAELHIEVAPAAQALLPRREFHALADITMPVLPAPDLFFGQAMHVYKHLSRDFMRTAHLLELYRHIVSRYEDTAFWREVEDRAMRHPQGVLGVGMAVQFASQQIGSCAPRALTDWSVERLPALAALWLERYGSRTCLASPPGNKLYLLLQRELARDEPGPKPARQRSLKARLLPFKPPPAISLPAPNETPRATLRRYRQQLWYIGYRLRFHVVEGLRFAIESHRWRRVLATGEGSRAPEHAPTKQ